MTFPNCRDDGIRQVSSRASYLAQGRDQACDGTGSDRMDGRREQQTVMGSDPWARRARKQDGGHMLSSFQFNRLLVGSVLCLSASLAGAQSFRVQCPTSTVTHPVAANNNSEPLYAGPTYTGTNGYGTTPANVNGAIKCQQISGGDGYAAMGDGTQTYLFSFGPLSGITDIALGKPGTQFPSVFNVRFPVTTSNFLSPGDPATTIGAATTPLTPTQLGTLASYNYNGAVGLDYNIANIVSIYDISESGSTVTVVTNVPLDLNLKVGDKVTISGVAPPAGDVPLGYQGTFTVTAVNVPNAFFPANFAFRYTAAATGLATVNMSSTAAAAIPKLLDGHVDPRQIMDVGVMNGNIPAPLMAIDEDDEFFLTLTNVGMIMRPDLFEQHTVHFHGYPNASSFYDGVPDASVAINIGGSFTYYYLAPDAGTYFWHCHISPPEHLQMGMVGQIYVRPRQNRVPASATLYAALQTQQGNLRTKCDSTDILCTNPLPAVNTNATGG